MKTRLSLMFVLAMGMALLLSWTVVGQRSEAKAIVLPAPPLDWGEGSSLGFTAPITFTPAYTVFLPVVMNRWPPPSQGISGRVTYRGNPIGGINVVLQRCTKTGTSTWTCSDLFTVATQPNGVYEFTDAPSLDSNQRYYVRYRNRSDGNADNPNYLRYWACNNIYTYAAGTNVAGGDFDIDNIPLTSPAIGVTVTLPSTFQWTRRSATPSDSYQLELYEAYDADPYWWSLTLGYVSSYTLSELPPGGFVNGELYLWGVWVHGPDGIGISYQHRPVTFSSGVASSQDAVQRLQRLHPVDIRPQ